MDSKSTEKERIEEILEVLYEHKSAKCINDLLVFNNMYNELNRLFSKFMEAESDRITESYCSEMQFLSKELKDGNGLNAEVYEEILKKEKENKKSDSEAEALLQSYTKLLGKIPNVKAPVMEYIAEKELSNNFKDFILFMFLDMKEDCEAKIFLFNCRLKD